MLMWRLEGVSGLCLSGNIERIDNYLQLRLGNIEVNRLNQKETVILVQATVSLV